MILIIRYTPCKSPLSSAYLHIRPVLSDVQVGEGAGGGVVYERAGADRIS